MPSKVRSIVISGNGANCEMEMAHACSLAGSDIVDIVHISDIIYGEKRLDDYHFLNLPGGFLDGDDLGAAQAGANRFRYATVKGTGERLLDQLLRFINAGKLVLGVCNGFQLMVKLGLLPGFDGDYKRRAVTLTNNDSGRFEDRWVHLESNGESPCIFTAGLSSLFLPVRHGEGKFITGDESVLERLQKEALIVLQYTLPDRRPTMEYPHNPNGSVNAIAGICDPTGRVFGLMPHPEAYLHYTNHPCWTREALPEEGQGLAFFRNAVAFVREHL
ncbi:MAG: phosphoribosylformylglycinamidine synthase subunit PurQ [Pseudomonadota bacterium]